ncbi:hypothetical protein [Staphylococcus shinii]|uniref:hypothetical protein n=1 Tax=Staphylococcus shinii TaxID=2912228 RepID=UPI003EEFD88A
MKTTIRQFNQSHNTEIQADMESYQIFNEMDKTTYECCYIAHNEATANKAILKEETLINLEDTFYLCVR